MKKTISHRLMTAILTVCALTGFASLAAAQSPFTENTNDIIGQQQKLPFEVSFSATTAIGPNDTWLWDGGFGFTYLASDNISVGVEALGYASTSLLSGSRDAISIAPMVEYHTPIASPLELAVGVGLPLQVRFGADLGTKLGTAPFARIGLDFRTSESFSFGIIERISYIVSDAYIMSEHGLPSGATVFATGIALKFHF